MESLTSIVAMAQRGDIEAFESLVGRFQDMAFAYALSVVGDRGLAEDVVQEAFLRAYLDLGSLRDPAAFPGWFRRVVLMRCNRLIRGKRLPTVELDGAAGLVAGDPSPEDEVISNQLQHQVSAAIQELPEREAVAINLHYIAAYSYAEVAEFLDVPVSTVKSRLYTGRRRLRTPLLKALKDDLRYARPSRDRAFSDEVIALVRRAMVTDTEGNVMTLAERSP